MKRIMYMGLAAMILAGAAVVPTLAQSNISETASPAETAPLGDYARKVRSDKKQPTAKKFDNDNLPKDDKLSVVGGAGEAPADATARKEEDNAAADDKAQADKKQPAPATVKPGQSQEEREQVYSEWQARIAGQKSHIDLLSRELDVEQREYKLRAAAMYGDAGDRLRNQANWDKEDADYKQKIAEKQKAVDEAKEELNNMEEEARKSGVPNSVRENVETPDNSQPQTASPK